MLTIFEKYTSIPLDNLLTKYREYRSSFEKWMLGIRQDDHRYGTREEYLRIELEKMKKKLEEALDEI